ncbi:hypothetical protein B0T39_00915 [Chromobacterium haemolyticum]|nr:hypothetical protein B0T39_00915 [Chromobacterium haemolyticum]
MIDAAHGVNASRWTCTSNLYQRLRHKMEEGKHVIRLDSDTATRSGIPAPCVRYEGTVALKRGTRTSIFYTAEGYALIANTHQSPEHKQIMLEMLGKYFGQSEASAQTPHVLAKSFNGTAFEFREDGYFNMTKAAKAYGKQLDEFWRYEKVQAYVTALGKALGFNSREFTGFKKDLTEAKKGRYHSGTWAHPKLAVFFARWLDVEFAVWCDMVIDSLLRGQTTINIQVDTPAEVLRVPETAGTLRASATYAANMELRKELEVAKEKARTLQERVEHLETAIRNRDDVAAWNAKLIAAAHGELKRLQELESRVKAVRGLLVAIGETVQLQ